MQALAEGLPPLSDLELEGIYRGLLEAKPDELALPALVAPVSPLVLADPTTDSESRRQRLQALTERLDAIEQAVVESVDEDRELLDGDDEPIGYRSALAELLKARRAGSVDEVEPDDAPAVDTAVNQSPGRELLDRVERVLPRQAIVASGAITVPMGLVVPSEWRDLVLLCVSVTPPVSDPPR